MSTPDRFRIYIAAFLVLQKDNQVLLQRRYQTGWQDGNYSLVSGHFEGNETAAECIIREAAEEIGISLQPADLTVAHMMHYRAADREYIYVFLTAQQWQGQIVNQEPDKCDQLSWQPLDQLPDNVIEPVRRALEDIERGVWYSQVGFV